MRELSKPGKTSILPQYLYSESMYERYLDAILKESNEIQRAFNSQGLKFADDCELDDDNLNFFIENKQKFEDEFEDELTERIGKKKTSEFYEIITENWFDGKSKREGLSVIQLFASIKEYLLERKAKSIDSIRVENHELNGVKPNFSVSEIGQILDLNKEMLDGFIPQWLHEHPNSKEIGVGDVYCRRGIFIDDLLNIEEYNEMNYLSSYSLAFTVTERFAQMKPSLEPAIINTNYDILRDRVIFFSPFIKGMNPHQFELGVIPHWFTLKMEKQGKHANINEYFLYH